ncbi:MAG: lytic transglycosylase [Alphaproteobacteria bacterium HGW-Alphaproteobacteria-6]|nr:MAG: lytic transglycosylase [Alphaproteobacteria bacterium HGW-Alphaproteobacteria-6]
MSRFLRFAVLMLLVSCGGNFSAPRNLDNACSIVDQRPKYLRAMQKAERRWGVPVHVQMATIHQESKFIGNARTPHRYALGVIPMGRQSSAYGYAQAIDGTWDDYRKANGRIGAKRDRIEDATDFMGWYMDQSEKKLGLSKWDARTQYLAYHEGHTGYARGSHNQKAWLLRVSEAVGERSRLYQNQLIACGKL